MFNLSSKIYITSFILLFIISTVILLIASTAKIPVPAWGGYMDVAIVALIAFTGFAIHQRSQSRPRFDTSYHFALYLFPLIIVGIWLYRNALDFNILLPGVAWRTYFFLSILPHALHFWKSEQPQ